MSRILDISGSRFGRLVAVRVERIHKTRGAEWLCRCDCGNQVVVYRGNLTHGNSRSCGCLKLDRLKGRATHGETTNGERTAEYEIWGSMIQRCTNPKAVGFRNYGGRGIGVCSSWFKFETFLEDMGRRPSPRHSLDRIDNSEGYSKSNCRWVLPHVQTRNTRRNRYVETPNGAMLLCDAAKESGIPEDVLWKRLKRGWAPKDLFRPLGTYTKTRQGKPMLENDR